MPKIILASKSPWRKRLLKKHGINCRIHVSSFYERTSGNPRLLVSYNARGKALDVAKNYNTGVVIGVDTIGVLGKKILLKPKNRAAAYKMLMTLSGKTHTVISGVFVIDCKTRRHARAAVETHVRFKQIGKPELEKYLDSGQWKGKAGGYAIQGRASKFVAEIRGDFSNIVGVPVEKLKKMLRKIQSSKSKYRTKSEIQMSN